MADNGLVLWPIVLQLVLISLNAVFACAEIAVITMNENKLALLSAAGNTRAIRLSKLTAHPARFLATIQVGITLAGFLGSAFAAGNFSGMLTRLLLNAGVPLPASTLETISVILITIVLAYLTLVLGELVPKRIAMRKAEQLALAMSGFIFVVSKIFAPLVWLLTLSTNGLLRLIGIDPHGEDDAVTEEEIRMLIDAGSLKGVIDPEEKDMIQNIFEFDDTFAVDIMTHRTEVSILWLDEDDAAWENMIINSRHSIYPICNESVDDVVGVLYAKDYLRLKDKTRSSVMSHAVRATYFVPETIRTDILFKNMKLKRTHFAVVIDEYGGLSGIVTMNDLLELLVGDLEDDIFSPRELPMIERIDSNTWRIRGIADLTQVAAVLEIKLPDDDYATFGGFVFGILESIPDDGSHPELEGYGLVIKVSEIRNHRLETAVVSLSEPVKDNALES